MMVKKAQSNVISTVLIVLIVVVAIAVIGIIVFKTVNKGATQIQVSVSCNDIVLTPKQCIYNNTHTYDLFQVRFANGAKLAGLVLISENQNGNSVTNVLTRDQTNSINNLQVASFLFSKDNSANPSSKFSLYAVVQNIDGSLANCPISTKIACSLPVVQGANPPGNSFITGASDATFTSLTISLLPPDVFATAKSTSSINVSWTSVNNATGYAVYRSLTSGGTYTIVANTSALSYLDSGLSAGTTYYYKVSAYNAIFNVTSILSNYASSTTSNDINNGLVLWMRFNNETGENSTFFRDFSPQGNNGTCTGSACPTLVAGKFGGAYKFDGINDYISIPNSPSLDIIGIPITISFWLNANATTATIPYPAVTKGAYSTLAYYIDLYNGNARITVGGATLNVNYIPYNNQWTHVVLMQNISGQYIFINDALVLSTAARSMSSTPDNALIGTRYGLSPYLNGTIDNILIFNRSLTQSEISSLLSGE